MIIEPDQNNTILAPCTPPAGITQTLTHKENNIYTTDTSTQTFFLNTTHLISYEVHNNFFFFMIFNF